MFETRKRPSGVSKLQLYVVKHYIHLANDFALCNCKKISLISACFLLHMFSTAFDVLILQNLLQLRLFALMINDHSLPNQNDDLP